MKKCSEGIECTFDYRLPLKLKELNLSSYTKGLIGMIGVVYWCETDDQMHRLIDKFYFNQKEADMQYYKSLMMEDEE